MVVRKTARAVCFIVALFAIGMLSSCAGKTPEVIEAPKTIGELSFDQNPEFGYTIYLPEEQGYAPYLVLTGAYQGNVLLLRKELLERPARISDYSSYYADSEMDQFLNADFLSTLPASLRQWIVPAEILISAPESIGVCGEECGEIVRSVFLLSCAEIGVNLSTTAREGDALQYFSDPERRVAERDGVASSWWLRSPDNGYVSCVFGVGYDGIVGSGNANGSNGVRPAFCVNAELPICLSEKLVEGRSVYLPLLSQ